MFGIQKVVLFNMNPIHILIYCDPLKGFPGREHSEVADHSLLFWGALGAVQLVQGHKAWLFWNAQVEGILTPNL